MCRGQPYNGAANMQPKGVWQLKIISERPATLPTHCLNLRLQGGELRRWGVARGGGEVFIMDREIENLLSTFVVEL